LINLKIPISFILSTMLLSAISLDRLVESGLANSSLIKKSNLELELMSAKKDESRAKRFGEIDVVGSYTHYNMPRTLIPLTPDALTQSNGVIATTQDLFSTGVQYSVSLFNGGALERDVDISQIGEKMMISKKRLSREELIYNIRSLYLSALSLKDMIASQKLYIKSLERVNRVIQKGVALGKKARIELLKSQNSIESAKGQLSIMQSSLRMVKSNLSSITHIDKIGKLEPLKRDISVKNISTKINDFDGLDRFKIKNLEIKKAEKRISKVEASKSPQVALNSYFGYNYDVDSIDPVENEQVWQVGLSAKWRLFDFGKTTAEVQQAKIAKLQAVTQKEEQGEMFKNLLAKAKYEIDKSFANYQTNLSQLNLLKENQKIEEARYNAGVSTINDLLLAKAQTEMSKSKLIESRYKYQSGIYYFDYLLEKGEGK